MSAPTTIPTVPGVPARVVAHLLATHRTQSAREQAQALGLSVGRVETCRWRLYRAGLLDKQQRARRRPWAPEEVERARWLLADGCTPAEAAAALGRTVDGLRRALVSYAGVPLGRARGGRTLEELVALFRCGRGTPALWVRAGYLRAQRYGPEPPIPARRGRRPPPRVHDTRHWHVTRDALLDFVGVRAAWMTYRAEDIQDADLRAYALARRREVPGRWVRFTEVARTLGYERQTVYGWHVARGWPGVGWEVVRWGRTLYLWLPPHTALPGSPYEQQWRSV